MDIIVCDEILFLKDRFCTNNTCARVGSIEYGKVQEHIFFLLRQNFFLAAIFFKRKGVAEKDILR